VPVHPRAHVRKHRRGGSRSFPVERGYCLDRLRSREEKLDQCGPVVHTGGSRQVAPHPARHECDPAQGGGELGRSASRCLFP